MTRRKSAGGEPSRNDGRIENPAPMLGPRAGVSIGRMRSPLNVLPLEPGPSEGRDTPELETAEQLSQWLSDRKFYDQYLRRWLEVRHPGASLFALYFPPSSIVREDLVQTHGEVRSSAVMYATGEALISIPAKTRRGAPTVADLTVPVRIRGHIQDGRFVFDEAYFVPPSAYFPPLIPDRVTRARRAARQ